MYLADGSDGREELLARLGPGVPLPARLDAVDLDVLRELIASSYHHAVTVTHAPEGGA